ncbi:MAG: amino acid/amide transporter substrate-binding protein family [Solirubrobacterales bacterium]|jgi:branched-chain amino acid transport system substrate-binding protein|nr:amino acid/amide transporter substrate-binding protein family [Solirubrobacterales bacterium]
MREESTLRYKIAAAPLALLLAAGMAACGSSSHGGGSSGDGPVTVALIPPLSGALGQFGKDTVTAWQFAADQANAKGGIDGHEVKIVTTATDGSPGTTVRLARQAVAQHGAHFIGAVMTGPENSALQKQLPAMNALSFNGTANDDVLNEGECSANAFRAVQSAQMDMNGIVNTLKSLPGDKWAIQAVDYSIGHSSADAFKAAAAKAGKQVVLTQFAPLGTSDFGSYITKLKSSGADALFSVTYGADAIALINQGAQFKLFDQFKTVLGFNQVSEPLFPALGKKIDGFYNQVNYDVDASNADNKAFVAAWTKKYGSPPYYVPADTYLAAQMLFKGIERAHSTDPQKVKVALGGLSFDSIAGKVTVRPQDHQLLRASYVGQVVPKTGGPGGLGFKIVAETPAKVTTPAASPSCKL